MPVPLYSAVLYLQGESMIKSFPIHSRLCQDDEFLTQSKVTTQSPHSGIADEISRKDICVPQLIWCIKSHGLGDRAVDFWPEGCGFAFQCSFIVAVCGSIHV